MFNSTVKLVFKFRTPRTQTLRTHTYKKVESQGGSDKRGDTCYTQTKSNNTRTMIR